LSGPVPEHGMDLSGAGHTRVFCKARAKRVKKLQQLYHELLRVVPDTFYAKRTPDDFNTFPDLFSVIYH
jgi:hypothetical protein